MPRRTGLELRETSAGGGTPPPYYPQREGEAPPPGWRHNLTVLCARQPDAAGAACATCARVVATTRATGCERESRNDAGRPSSYARGPAAAYAQLSLVGAVPLEVADRCSCQRESPGRVADRTGH